jgi:hypothetical protein
MRRVKSLLVASLVLAPALAVADPGDDLVAIRSRVGWGATVEPDRVALSTEGGWNGGEARAQANATIEAAVYGRASVLATTSYDDRARPSVGAAVQVLDPRTHAVGVRISAAYKPEGFTEPEGELESALVLVRPIARGAVRAMLAYGRDPEGNESDAELGASYVQRAADRFVVGGTARYRRGIAVKPGEPSWDVIGGGIAGFVPGSWRVELMVGGSAVEYMRVQAGFVGLLSVGADL